MSRNKQQSFHLILYLKSNNTLSLTFEKKRLAVDFENSRPVEYFPQNYWFFQYKPKFLLLSGTTEVIITRELKL